MLENCGSGNDLILYLFEESVRPFGPSFRLGFRSATCRISKCIQRLGRRTSRNQAEACCVIAGLLGVLDVRVIVLVRLVRKPSTRSSFP